jgi:hypothetical protein
MATMATMTALLGIFFGMMLVGAIVSGVFIWIGAKIAGIPNPGFGRCVLVAIVTSVCTWLLSFILSILPVVGTFGGFILGLIVSLLIIKSMFNVPFGQAFLVWIFHALAQGVAIFIAVLTFAGGILALAGLARS